MFLGGLRIPDSRINSDDRESLSSEWSDLRRCLIYTHDMGKDVSVQVIVSQFRNHLIS